MLCQILVRRFKTINYHMVKVNIKRRGNLTSLLVPTPKPRMLPSLNEKYAEAHAYMASSSCAQGTHEAECHCT